jgi:bacterial/archaeal transporter family protein
VKNLVMLAVLVITQVLGDIWLSQGMKQFGAITVLTPEGLLNLIGYLLTSPWILLGVSTLTFSMLIYLIAISRLDISYVLPIHAFSYVLNALMAWLILNEHVSGVRWLATILITVGVFIISWSEQRSTANLTSKVECQDTQPFLRGNRRLLLFLGGSSPAAIPQIGLGALTLAIADSAGDLLTAMGVKQIGKIPSVSPSKLLMWVGQVLSNPFMIAGIMAYATGFAIFISLLSWADISLVRPATAVGYVISLLGARFILQERVSRGRLIGIVMIGAGVGTLSLT